MAEYLSVFLQVSAIKSPWDVLCKHVGALSFSNILPNMGWIKLTDDITDGKVLDECQVVFELFTSDLRVIYKITYVVIIKL